MEPKAFSVRSVRLLYNRVENSYRRVTEQSSDNWEVGQFSTSQYEVISEVNELVKKWIIAAEEYKESAGEELTQCVYSKIEALLSTCKSHLVYIQ
jgi:hypothetical protein